MAEWADAIKQATEDDDVRVLLVTGAGRAFCAGADLKAEASSDDRVLMAEKNAGERRNSLRYSVHRVAQALQYCDKPYIAVLNGAAVGAGMDMASMADIRLASDTARFGMSYVNVGLIPGDGGAWLLPRIVGLQKALELIWSGDLFDAATALDIGYVNQVFPHDDLMAEARSYATKLAEALIRVLDNPTEAEEMGLMGKKRIDTKFSLEKMVRGTASVYIDALSD